VQHVSVCVGSGSIREAKKGEVVTAVRATVAVAATAKAEVAAEVQ
jgi:hypothetical protein